MLKYILLLFSIFAAPPLPNAAHFASILKTEKPQVPAESLLSAASTIRSLQLRYYLTSLQDIHANSVSFKESGIDSPNSNAKELEQKLFVKNLGKVRSTHEDLKNVRFKNPIATIKEIPGNPVIPKASKIPILSPIKNAAELEKQLVEKNLMKARSTYLLGLLPQIPETKIPFSKDYVQGLQLASDHWVFNFRQATRDTRKQLDLILKTDFDHFISTTKSKLSNGFVKLKEFQDIFENFVKYKSLEAGLDGGSVDVKLLQDAFLSQFFHKVSL